ncbi:hypothetical protein TL16_g07209 [Triparma laevis f. inornata]|uniref:Uncharacterized protein n=1 Tax=Triparma laevis f. inornata TaxID=1714386 RepID=A0A9W7AXH4_9STRA|nr:hypothetical protein TL16_g07209 [Triparma laevis f. inornata]
MATIAMLKGEKRIRLEVFEGKFGTRGVSALASTIENSGCVLALRLVNCQIGDTGALGLADSLLRNPKCSIVELDLCNVGLDVRGLEALTTAACEIPTLKVLGVGQNGLKKQAGVVIGRAMRLRNGLPGLHCSDNKLGDHGAAAIGGALAAVTDVLRVTMLDLSRNSIGPEGMLAFCKGLRICSQSNVTPIMVLRLRGNEIGCEGAVTLAKILKNRSNTLSATLEELDLGECGLKEKGATAICESWANCSVLRACSIDGSIMSPTIVRSSAAGLSENSSLIRIDISPTMEGVEVSEALESNLVYELGAFSEALKSNTTLLTLNLGMYISNPGASQTAGSIQSTLMLNARLAGMEALAGNQQNPAISKNDDGTTASVLNAMSDAVAAANGRATPKAPDPSMIQGFSSSPTHATQQQNNIQQQQEQQQNDPPPPPNQSMNMNPFASPPAEEKKTPERIRNSNPHNQNGNGVHAPQPLHTSFRGAATAVGAFGFGNSFSTQPPQSEGQDELGNAMITQQLKQQEQILVTDAIRAARSAWEAERSRDLERVKIECAETARKDMLTMETKLVEIVGALASDLKRAEEKHEEDLAKVEEKIGEIVSQLSEKGDELEERVGMLEGNQKTIAKKIDTIARALHSVEAKTNDGNYIQNFVQDQYTKMRDELKTEIKKDLHAQQEKSITSLEVNRHIDHSRIEGKLNGLVDRLGKLEQTVVAEQQNSVQVLEAILSANK